VLPLRAVSLARQVVSQRGGVSLMDVLLGFAEGLPSGAYTGAGIEKYLHEVLSEPGRTDDFGELACELYLTANRPRHVRARRVRRRRSRRRADLHRRARVGRAADGLRAGSHR